MHQDLAENKTRMAKVSSEGRVQRFEVLSITLKCAPVNQMFGCLYPKRSCVPVVTMDNHIPSHLFDLKYDLFEFKT